MEQQKIVLVTGAGSGIGKASAIAFSAKGHSVVLAGRRRDRLEQVASVCSNETLIVEADVADPESVVYLFKTLKEQFARLDVLFNNAGGGSPPRQFEEIPFEEWQRVINV
ncbi:MAG: SDR family oxidoreductase, partial [Gammaproteobacteria bacterium]|nr:SDR family oxidoreductase [Gammaproteobacteria bacterium]